MHKRKPNWKLGLFVKGGVFMDGMEEHVYYSSESLEGVVDRKTVSVPFLMESESPGLLNSIWSPM